jgi:hypothetical protein
VHTAASPRGAPSIRAPAPNQQPQRCNLTFSALDAAARLTSSRALYLDSTRLCCGGNEETNIPDSAVCPPSFPSASVVVDACGPAPRAHRCCCCFWSSCIATFGVLESCFVRLRRAYREQSQATPLRRQLESFSSVVKIHQAAPKVSFVGPWQISASPRRTTSTTTPVFATAARPSTIYHTQSSPCLFQCYFHDDRGSSPQAEAKPDCRIGETRETSKARVDRSAARRRGALERSCLQ